MNSSFDTENKRKEKVRKKDLNIKKLSLCKIME